MVFHGLAPRRRRISDRGRERHDPRSQSGCRFFPRKPTYAGTRLYFHRGIYGRKRFFEHSLSELYGFDKLQNFATDDSRLNERGQPLRHRDQESPLFARGRFGRRRIYLATRGGRQIHTVFRRLQYFVRSRRYLTVVFYRYGFGTFRDRRFRDRRRDQHKHFDGIQLRPEHGLEQPYALQPDVRSAKFREYQILLFL